METILRSHSFDRSETVFPECTETKKCTLKFQIEWCTRHRTGGKQKKP